jgi:hypothetical protein
MPFMIVPIKVCAMGQVDFYQSVNVEAWFQSQAIPYGIFVDKVALVPGSSLSTQVFPSQDYSTIAPDSFIQLS